MSTKTFTEREQAVIDRVEADLLSGRYFTLIANSHKSVPLGRGPASARGWGGAMQAIAKFAAEGDWFASVAYRTLGRVNLYLTPNEVHAQIAARFADIVAEGYTDVIGMTGPEASRPSAYEHPTTLRQAILLALLMVEVHHRSDFLGSVPGIGWCLRALMERENVPVSAHLFPALHAAEALRAQS